jgi:signal transduction histidine kinase
MHGDLSGTWDPDRLGQALSNLARNAVEHAAPETRAVLEAFDDGSQVVVEVRNQGDPIPADEVGRLFQPFQRRGGARGSNLGLGLYIADQIVGLHGGTLEGSSEAGTTTFRIRLPRTPPTRQQY